MQRTPIPSNCIKIDNPFWSARMETALVLGEPVAERGQPPCIRGEGIMLIPYMLWDNRDGGPMAVWLKM